MKEQRIIRRLIKTLAFVARNYHAPHKKGGGYSVLTCPYPACRAVGATILGALPSAGWKRTPTFGL